MVLNNTMLAGLGATALGAMIIAPFPASAADLTPATPQPAPMARQQEPAPVARSPWQIRLRALGVVTHDDGSVDGIPGSDLSYSDTVIPELDISYYFPDHLAAELILGTTYSSVNADGSIAALGDVGKVWVLPPTLTLQYHFTDFGAFKPYLGAGVNYTIFYDQEAEGAFDDLDVDDSFGVAVQAGFDYMIDDNWGWNVDVKKLFLKADWNARLNGTDLSGEADLDPWLIGTGVTYRF